MASIIKTVDLDAEAAHVWDAVRDVEALPTRLVPGFVTATELEPASDKGTTRVVTFFNGLVVRERIVAIDDAARRLSYSVVGTGATHHNASVQVFDRESPGGRGACRLVWITDVLPDQQAETIAPMMDGGAAALRRMFEGSRSRA